MMGGELGLRGKKFVGDGKNWVRKSDENPGKWTNEPEQGQMGSMRNA